MISQVSYNDSSVRDMMFIEKWFKFLGFGSLNFIGIQGRFGAKLRESS